MKGDQRLLAYGSQPAFGISYSPTCIYFLVNAQHEIRTRYCPIPRFAHSTHRKPFHLRSLLAQALAPRARGAAQVFLRASLRRLGVSEGSTATHRGLVEGLYRASVEQTREQTLSTEARYRHRASVPTIPSVPSRSRGSVFDQC